MPKLLHWHLLKRYGVDLVASSGEIVDCKQLNTARLTLPVPGVEKTILGKQEAAFDLFILWRCNMADYVEEDPHPV